MLHDYELALSSYRLILTDYDIDKAWKHYAGVQVASHLCNYVNVEVFLWHYLKFNIRLVFRNLHIV